MRRQKVEEIKKLLLHTDYTLDKIAEGVGIELQQLHALFHKADGISPGKFRKANATMRANSRVTPCDLLR